jgi:cyclopropane-fatty-acyl-phospholipid synthase
VNGIAGSQRNVKRHYDLPQNLYRLFLDPDLQYSCAYYRSINDSLEKAQLNKKHHIATKLLLDRPALRVLDIGSGWGGLGIFLAQIARAAVTGITLSKEQLLTSRSRAAEAGLSGAVCFYHRDYRQEHGEYDRVVSVGMLEHVGKRHYARYFQKIHELLTNEGVALVHTIGYADSPAPIDPFIRKFIFPGAELPSLSELLPAIEKSGLYVTDIEILRLHYARTLQQWRDRLSAHRNKIIDIHGVSFYRMWEYYLALCEVGFRLRSNVVFQIQLAKDPGVVPPTRDYMYETISDKMDLELTPSNRTRDGLGQNVLAG